MTKVTEHWKQTVDSLMKEGLSSADAQLLARGLDDTDECAEDIVFALKVQKQLDSIGLQKAPPSLHKRLLAIPGIEKKKSYGQWAGALSAAAAVMMALYISFLPEQQVSSEEEIKQATRELIIAFQYLDATSNRSSQLVEEALVGTLKKTMYKSVSRRLDKQTEEI